MKVIKGLFNNMVLQRNKENVCEAAFEGECRYEGTLRLYAKKEGKEVKGFHAVEAGMAKKRAFRGVLKGLPAGGPYEINLAVETPAGERLEGIQIRNLLVGDVWILAGQSNMEGIGYLKYALPPHPDVRAFYMDDRWDTAKDPLHVLGQAVDEVHVDLCGGARPEASKLTGVGPGVSFAQEMLKFTGVPQGVIACAHGGTSMSQWDPSLKKLGGKSLYGAMLRRFEKNGGKAAGVVWYQGCSDTGRDTAPLYTERMKEFVKSVRRDFHDGKLFFIIVQISRVCGGTGNPWYWNSVQDQQRRLPKTLRNLAVVPAIDLALDDAIHISGYDQNRLGARCAQAMAVLKGIPGAGKPPLAVGSVKMVKDPYNGMVNIVVNVLNVMGKLKAPGRPAGFELSEKPYELTHHGVYRIDLSGNKVILKTVFPFSTLCLFLFYGYGIQPYCNITDEADRPLPVMGPLKVVNGRAVTHFITEFKISGFQPSAGKLHNLGYPEDPGKLGFARRNFPGNFCSLHQEMDSIAPRDVVVYYAADIECGEKMDLKLLLGYDGPVKIWFDKQEIFHDPGGTNPALPGDAKIAFSACKGKHEILVALGSNNGKAWGIFAQIERTDVPKKLIKKGPEYYRMPVVGIL
ncbi:MAG: sialate O-acetylesterase [Bacillota bacterium]